MKKEFKKYYIEEYIFSSYTSIEPLTLNRAEKFLDRRLKELLSLDFNIGQNKVITKSGWYNSDYDYEDTNFLSEREKNQIKDDEQSLREYGPSNEDLAESEPDPESIGEPVDFHFIIAIDKNFNKYLNNTKLFAYKIINNLNLKKDIEKSYREYEPVLSKINLDNLKNEPEKLIKFFESISFFDKILKNYKIPIQFNFIIFEMFKNIGNENYILDNLNSLIKVNLTYKEFFNQLVYLSSDSFNRLEINVKSYKPLSTKNNKSSIIISYLQDKYFSKLNKIPRFDIDKYLKLKELDQNKNLSDWQKADILFPPSDILVPREEDQKRKNIIRVMRKRGKKYFK